MMRKPPKYEVFTAVIEQHIRKGVLQPGQKLPSIRTLKEEYGISASTIQQGYDHLVIKGLVESAPKSGYYVSSKAKRPATPSRPVPIIRDAVFENNLALITAQPTGQAYTEFNVAAPGDLLIPQKLLLRTLQQVIREEGAKLLRYYPAAGSPALKESIASRATRLGTPLHPAGLLITDGGLQGLYLALSTVCSPGDVVAVESPCVFSSLEVIRVLQLKVIEVPVDQQTGFDVDYLAHVCTRHRPKAILVTPNFHNPTGLLLPMEKKKALLAIAQQYDIPIIENDLYGDLHFEGTRPATISSYDDSGLVLTYSAYSKTLASGIRLGWLSPGRFFARAEQLRFAMGSTVAPLYQEAVYRLNSSGQYDRHIRRFRAQLARNAALITQLITRSFPTGTLVLPPAGGYNSWIQMPARTNMDAFYQLCTQIGIRFTPGYAFSFSTVFDKCFRAVFADQLTPKKTKAIRLAGQRSAAYLY